MQGAAKFEKLVKAAKGGVLLVKDIDDLWYHDNGQVRHNIHCVKCFEGTCKCPL